MKRTPKNLDYPDCPTALRAAREAARITQAQAAERLGVSQAQWNRLERGQRDPFGEFAAMVAQLRAMAAAVGLDPEAFLALAEKTRKNPGI